MKYFITSDHKSLLRSLVDELVDSKLERITVQHNPYEEINTNDSCVLIIDWEKGRFFISLKAYKKIHEKSDINYKSLPEDWDEIMCDIHNYNGSSVAKSEKIARKLELVSKAFRKGFYGKSTVYDKDTGREYNVFFETDLNCWEYYPDPDELHKEDDRLYYVSEDGMTHLQLHGEGKWKMETKEEKSETSNNETDFPLTSSEVSQSSSSRKEELIEKALDRGFSGWTEMVEASNYSVRDVYFTDDPKDWQYFPSVDRLFYYDPEDNSYLIYSGSQRLEGLVEGKWGFKVIDDEDEPIIRDPEPKAQGQSRNMDIFEDDEKANNIFMKLLQISEGLLNFDSEKEREHNNSEFEIFNIKFEYNPEYDTVRVTHPQDKNIEAYELDTHDLEFLQWFFSSLKEDTEKQRGNDNKLILTTSQLRNVVNRIEQFIEIGK